jgi:hypothetical protein
MNRGVKSMRSFRGNKPSQVVHGAIILGLSTALAACAGGSGQANTNTPGLTSSGASGTASSVPSTSDSAGVAAVAGTTSTTPTAGTGTSLGTAGTASAGTAAAAGSGSAAAGAAGTTPASAGSSGAGVSGAAAGSGAAGTAGETAASGAGASGQGGASEPPHEDLGKGTGSDVVLIGDSWMSNTLQIEGTGGGIAPSLIAVAKNPYRNYAVQGVMLLQADTYGPAIPTQWDQAKRVNPMIKTVVMTGGGNDIIQNPTLEASCKDGTDMCKQLLIKIGDALNTLWTQMANDGVQDIVYIQYAEDVGTLNASLRGDNGTKTPEICLSGKVRCHAVNTTAAVMHQIAGDNIHPLQAANDRVAKVVYDLMVSEGIRR